MKIKKLKKFIEINIIIVSIILITVGSGGIIIITADIRSISDITITETIYGMLLMLFSLIHIIFGLLLYLFESIISHIRKHH